MDDQDALDLVGLVLAERLFDALGIGAGAPLFVLDDDLRWLNWPKRAAKSLLPGELVLVRADSQAPVPLDGKITTWPSLVLKIRFKSSYSGKVSLGKSEER